MFRYGQPDTISSLLEYGINIDVGNEGWTALQLAVLNGHTDIVSILLNKGANSTLCNRYTIGMGYFQCCEADISKVDSDFDLDGMLVFSRVIALLYTRFDTCLCLVRCMLYKV